MSIELKIKAKHLALEPHVIRHEERKLKKQIRYTQGTDALLIMKLNSLVCHRRWNVRNESRATELARAYIAGKAYTKVEQKRKPENEYTFQRFILPRIVAMVTRYGSGEQRKVTSDTIKEWSML